MRARTWGIWCLAVLIAAACNTAATAAPKEAPKPVARVTISQGTVTADGAHGARRVTIASPLYNGDRVVVANQGAAATLLLDSRVVVALDSGAAMRLIEQRGKTELRLERGDAEVFVGQRPPDLGPVALVDPESVIETTGTIFLASYSPQTRTGVYACEEKAIKLSTRGGQNVTVPAGRQARVRGGAFQGLEKFDRALTRRQGNTLPAMRNQSLLYGARAAQQRQFVASARDTFVADFKASGYSGQQSEQLADLLAGRCLDLHGDAADVQGATVRASPGGRLLMWLDDYGAVAPDGDVIEYTARSCTASILSNARDQTVAGIPFPLYTPQAVELPVDAPNIVEITIRGVDAGTARPKITVRIGFEGFISEPKEFEPLRRVKLEEGETHVYRVYVVPADTPAPTPTAAAAANKATLLAAAGEHRASRAASARSLLPAGASKTRFGPFPPSERKLMGPRKP